MAAAPRRGLHEFSGEAEFFTSTKETVCPAKGSEPYLDPLSGAASMSLPKRPEPAFL